MDAQVTRKSELRIRGARHSVEFAMALERAEFVRRLREARKAAGYTQAQLAIESGVELKTYNRWEALNGNYPRGHNLDRLVQALGVNREYLLGPAPGQRTTDQRLVELEQKIDDQNVMLRALLAHHGITIETLAEPPAGLIDDLKPARTKRRRSV